MVLHLFKWHGIKPKPRNTLEKQKEILHIFQKTTASTTPKKKNAVRPLVRTEFKELGGDGSLYIRPLLIRHHPHHTQNPLIHHPPSTHDSPPTATHTWSFLPHTHRHIYNTHSRAVWKRCGQEAQATHTCCHHKAHTAAAALPAPTLGVRSLKVANYTHWQRPPTKQMILSPRPERWLTEIVCCLGVGEM